MKFKKGDEVKILRGKDKGKKGKIEKVFSKEKKIMVGGINEFKRHLKANAQTKQSGGIVTITKPLFIANVMLVCPKCNLGSRVGFLIERGKKTRICKRCKNEI